MPTQESIHDDEIKELRDEVATPNTRIHLDDGNSSLIIEHLTIQDTSVYELISQTPTEDRLELVKRALSIGVLVLQTMDTSTRVDYVRSEFTRMQQEINNELAVIFSNEGKLSRELDRFLGESGMLKQTLDEHFGEQGSLIFKILNPQDESTPLGQFRKLLTKELDCEQDGTSFNKLTKTMNEGFQNILISISALNATKKERMKSTAKGADFQSYVHNLIDEMARDFEDTVTFVGNEKGLFGKTGDVLIHINPKDTRGMDLHIVVEVKNASIQLSGKNSFLNELEKARENRTAQFSIGAVHESEIPSACGCYRRYHNNHIICSVSEDDYPIALEVAYKVARAELILSSYDTDDTIDLTKLEEKTMAIKNQLDSIRSIKGALTAANSKIDDARQNLENMVDTIRDILSEIQSMIKSRQ